MIIINNNNIGYRWIAAVVEVGCIGRNVMYCAALSRLVATVAAYATCHTRGMCYRARIRFVWHVFELPAEAPLEETREVGRNTKYKKLYNSNVYVCIVCFCSAKD